MFNIDDLEDFNSGEEVNINTKISVPSGWHKVRFSNSGHTETYNRHGEKSYAISPVLEVVDGIFSGRRFWVSNIWVRNKQGNGNKYALRVVVAMLKASGVSSSSQIQKLLEPEDDGNPGRKRLWPSAEMTKEFLVRVKNEVSEGKYLNVNIKNVQAKGSEGWENNIALLEGDMESFLNENLKIESLLNINKDDSTDAKYVDIDDTGDGEVDDKMPF